jgi:hypothetical protein
MLRVGAIFFHILSTLLILAAIIFLVQNYDAKPYSLWPFLLASGACLAVMTASFIKSRTHRQTMWGLYLYFWGVMILMLVVSVLLSLSYYIYNPLPPLSMSSVAFVISIVTMVGEFRVKYLLGQRETGCVITSGVSDRTSHPCLCVVHVYGLDGRIITGQRVVRHHL